MEYATKIGLVLSVIYFFCFVGQLAPIYCQIGYIHSNSDLLL